MRFQRTAALALLCVACSESAPGKKLASGLARGLVARDGAVAFLADTHRPDDASVPEDLLAGDLWLDDRKVGSGVATGEGAYGFSPRGELAFLARWRFRDGEGELWVASRGAEPRQVAKAARSFSWSTLGELAFVAHDAVGIGERTVPLPAAQAIAWAPDGRRLAVRAAAAAGGRLWSVDARSATSREIAIATSDFAFAPDGALAALGPPPAKGGDRPLLIDGVRLADATAFTFSPDGREIALFSTGKHPGESSGELYRIPRSGGAPRPVASRVTEWRWSTGGDLLCLARYDLRARAGTLMAASPGAPTKEISPRVQSFSIFGRRLLYQKQVPLKGDFKIELWAVDLATPDAAPHRIDEGVYGWDLAPDGSEVYYKARCAGGSRSCSLLRTAFSGGAPELLAGNVAGFDLSRDGARILVQQPHRGAARAVDLAVISATAAPQPTLNPLVQEADPGSRFADDAGHKVAYAIVAAGKGGVFLADVP
jgi:hypothetical protein